MNDDSKRFFAIDKPDSPTAGASYFYPFSPRKPGDLSPYSGREGETHIHTLESIFAFMEFKKRLSATFKKGIEGLKPGQEIRAMKSSAGRSLYFRRMTEEECEALDRAEAVHEELQAVREKIRAAVPQDLVLKEKELQKTIKALHKKISAASTS